MRVTTQVTTDTAEVDILVTIMVVKSPLEKVSQALVLLTPISTHEPQLTVYLADLGQVYRALTQASMVPTNS